MLASGMRLLESEPVEGSCQLVRHDVYTAEAALTPVDFSFSSSKILLVQIAMTWARPSSVLINSPAQVFQCSFRNLSRLLASWLDSSVYLYGAGSDGADDGSECSYGGRRAVVGRGASEVVEECEYEGSKDDLGLDAEAD